jgi:H/ACA ribonucleoprotein complex subunit 3
MSGCKMPTHILKCPKCSTYTLSESCPKCGTTALPPIPAKYSPEDQYGKYRREAKKESLKEKGII